MATPDPFDAYFRRADADRDGRISGQEAVAFFQGTNLSREVLAKIWVYADQGQSGFLSRPQFYHALKLVTVAQTGRELTPAIASAALREPAASQIPVPQIHAVPGHVPTPQPVGVRPAQPLGPSTQQFPQYPPRVAPPGAGATAPVPQPRAPLPQTPGGLLGSSSDWPTNKSSSWSGPVTTNSQPNQPKPSVTGSSSLVSPDLFGGSAFQAGSNGSASKVPSSKSADPNFFGGDVFTAVKGSAAPVRPMPNLLATQTQPGTPQPHTTAALQRTANPADPVHFALVPTSAVPTTPIKQVQPVSVTAGAVKSDAQNRGLGATTPGNDAAKNWPKMSDSVVRRYAEIFFKVDTDKDGRISGIQARDLFLSWHLPREVLKQVWDLSDQDHDSMLSLREFCTALYLMERFREGRTLSTATASAFYFDESGVQALRIAEAQVAVAQNSAGYNLRAWQNNPSVLHGVGQAISGLPPRPQGSSRPPMPVPRAVSMQLVQPTPASGGQPVQTKSKAPVLEMNFVNQLNADDQLTLQAKHQEAADAEKKVQELEKVIMDSKEKMEYYRSKLQDIVLFKTRCDNRLAEITERAASDKREVEAFAKRYDEKFKQAGESQSRLLADEAAFRDVQERRLELYNALLRMEQGGDTNALLQSRADRLHNDLDELRKTLNAKCKQLGLRIKPTSILELPFGWQPGIQENAVEWDENWDKFEDEGFVYIQDFMEEGTAGSNSAKPKTASSWAENGTIEGNFDFSTENAEVELEDAAPRENLEGGASPQADSDDETIENGDISPTHVTASPSRVHHGSDSLSNGKESKSDDRAPLSPYLDDASAGNGDDWASAFSHRDDDTDSNGSWGLSNKKGLVENNFQPKKSDSASAFGFSDPFDMLSSSATLTDSHHDFPSLEPIRTKQKSVFFDNSVPSTPLYNNASPVQTSNTSPFDIYGSEDQLARFDSFRSNVNDFAPPSDSFARFDSFSSVRDSGPRRGFTSFDDSADPFSGTGPFGGTQTPKRSTDTWGAFS